MIEHTKEPWFRHTENFGELHEQPVGQLESLNIIAGFNFTTGRIAEITWAGETVYAADITKEHATQNARRIVACVNACKGITSESLETMGLGGICKAIAQVVVPLAMFRCGQVPLEQMIDDVARSEHELLHGQGTNKPNSKLLKHLSKGKTK